MKISYSLEVTLVELRPDGELVVRPKLLLNEETVEDFGERVMYLGETMRIHDFFNLTMPNLNAGGLKQ